MALNAATTWEVRSTGSDNNGGGFHTGASGTDRSQQDAAFASGVNLTVDATTNTDVAPDGITPGASDVGNIIQITAGASFTLGFYEIASIQAGKWRLDRSPAAVNSTGGTWAYGGALATPGKACGAKVASNMIWVKFATYTFTTSTTNVAGGIVNDVLGGVGLGWEGYEIARGDLGQKPTFSAGALTSQNLFSATVASTAGMIVRNINIDGVITASNVCWNLARRDTLFRCTATRGNIGFFTSDINTMVECVANGCAQASGGTRGNYFACVAKSCTGAGWSTNGLYVDCIAYANGNLGFQGSQTVCLGCTAYGNGSDGYRAGGESCVFISCIAEANGGWGFTASAPQLGTVTRTCATFSNTSGAVNTTNIPAGVGMIPYTVTAFVAAASGNFTLNNDPNGGMLLRGAGFPGLFPLGFTTGYKSVGAVQDTSPSVAAIADAVWDELIAGHSIASSFGDKITAQMKAVLKVVVGTGSTPTSVVLSTVEGNTPSSIDDFYLGRAIAFNTGSLANSAIAIVDYIGATKTAVVSQMPLAPANGDTAIIV